MKEVLIIGGTQFIGRNLVDTLIKESNLSLTLFNRNQTNSHLFPGIKRISGDRRSEEIAQIKNKSWDFIIDLCAYYPKDIENLIKNLVHTPEKYILISTCSVYDMTKYQRPYRHENSPILNCSELQAADHSVESYGNRKAECERVLRGSNIPFVIWRPALVYGPYDPTDRLYYWLYSLKKRDFLLLPEEGKRKFSMTYVQDLVELIRLCLSSNHINISLNAISHPAISIVEIAESMALLWGKSFQTKNLTKESLFRNKIKEWTDIPLWLSNDDFIFSPKKSQELFGFEASDLKSNLKKSCAYYQELNWPAPNYGIPQNKLEEFAC